MPETPRSVMLFAAGFGTRMGALTADRPKPLIEVDGQPLIDHALDLAAALSPETLVANIHYKPQMMSDHLVPKGVKLSVEDGEILETGGGLRKALGLLGDGPVFTMNTDAIWTGPNPLLALLDAWDASQMDALLMCVPKGQAVGFQGAGNFVPDTQGCLTRGDGLIYGGVQILKTDLLDEVEETSFSLNVVWDQMIEKGRLYGLSHSDGWCDVGRPEGIALAEDMIRGAHV